MEILLNGLMRATRNYKKKVGVDGNPTRYKWACMLVHRY